MDHPVPVLRLEEHEAIGHPGAVEHELDLGVRPLLHLVVAAVPDRHLAAAVLAFGYLPLEGRVLEGVVLGVHREMVLLRRFGKPFGESPRSEHATALQPQVPVETPGMVLLDHEPRLPRALRSALSHGFGCPAGAPLGAIRLELALPLRCATSGHCTHGTGPGPVERGPGRVRPGIGHVGSDRRFPRVLPRGTGWVSTRTRWRRGTPIDRYLIRPHEVCARAPTR